MLSEMGVILAYLPIVFINNLRFIVFMGDHVMQFIIIGLVFARVPLST